MFERLAEHIYVYPCDGFTDRPNIGLIIGEKYTLLFDGGNSAAHVALMKQDLERQELPMPDAVVCSHWHWDHSFGCSGWNIPIIAGRETSAQLETIASSWKWDDSSMEDRVARGDEIRFCHEMIKREYSDRSLIHVATADVVFDGRMTINLGGVFCELIHCKGPHSSDSILCYIPEDKFIFLGDSDCKDLYGLPWEFDIEHEDDFKKNTDAIPYDKEKVRQYLKLLDELDFTVCISGHSKAKPRNDLYAALTEGK